MNSGLKMLLGMAVGICLTQMYNRPVFEQARSDARHVRFVDNMFRVKQGYINSVGNYFIASTDCGRTWYNVESVSEPNLYDRKLGYIPQGGYKILSQVDPEVLAKIAAWDIINDYIEKNGKLNPVEPEQRKALEKVGFRVVWPVSWNGQ